MPSFCICEITSTVCCRLMPHTAKAFWTLKSVFSLYRDSSTVQMSYRLCCSSIQYGGSSPGTLSDPFSEKDSCVLHRKKGVVGFSFGQTRIAESCENFEERVLIVANHVECAWIVRRLNDFIVQGVADFLQCGINLLGTILLGWHNPSRHLVSALLAESWSTASQIANWLRVVLHRPWYLPAV